MKYLKPTKEGYYWYRESNDWGYPWNIVKVQFYSRGYMKPKSKLVLKKPRLMVQLYGFATLKRPIDMNGIWGKRVKKLRKTEYK